MRLAERLMHIIAVIMVVVELVYIARYKETTERVVISK